jgi:hypothetical protein
VVLCSVSAGLVVGRLTAAFPSSAFAVGAAVAAAALVITASRRPGLGLGLWVIAAANAIPFVDLNQLNVVGAFKLQDGLMVVLAAAAALSWTRDPPDPAQRRVVTPMALALFALATWWTLTWFRTVATEHVTVVLAALFGRDLLYPTIAAVCAAVMIRGLASLRTAVNVSVAGLTIWAFGYLVTVTLHVGSGAVFAMSGLAVMGPGVYRGYGEGNIIAMCVAFVAMWGAFTLRGKLAVGYGVSAVILTTQVAAALTRANYVGLLVGLIVTIALATFGRSYQRMLSHVTRRVVQVLVALAGGGLIYAILSSAGLKQSESVGFLAGRVSSLYGVLFGGSSTSVGTWNERVQWAQQTLAVIGHQWFWGLGFLHPAARPFPQLVDGTLRNSHLGVLDSVAPYGVLGVALALVLPILMLVMAARPRVPDTLGREEKGIVLGVAGIVVAGLASMATMTTLFTSPSVGLFIGLGLSVALGGLDHTLEGGLKDQIETR